MFLIVGLGNPGPKFENTRHNLGFRVIDQLAREYRMVLGKEKGKAFIGQGDILGHKVILAKPQTFMNESGEAVYLLSQWYKILPTHLIVVHDDVDLELGQLRVRPGGNSGGHKGIESIIKYIGTTEFARVRLGIGRSEVIDDTRDYVLGKITPGEQPILEKTAVEAAEASLAIITHNVEFAMNEFNRPATLRRGG